MKGNISLKSFVEEVKSELRSAIDEDDPFFLMGEVELEVSFTLNANAQGSAKLIVVDVEGGFQASQIHKVKLKLTPFIKRNNGIMSKPPCG